MEKIYSDEEKKAIEILSLKCITSSIDASDYPNTIVMKKDLTIALNLIEKLTKIINEMIEYINSNVILYPECDVGCEKDTNCRTCILKYFEEKVKKNK